MFNVYWVHPEGVTFIARFPSFVQASRFASKQDFPTCIYNH